MRIHAETLAKEPTINAKQTFRGSAMEWRTRGKSSMEKRGIAIMRYSS